MENNRELFRAIYDGQCKTDFCLYEQGLWKETYQRWQKEGLPENLADSPLKNQKNAIIPYDKDIFRHLNILWPCFLPVRFQPVPGQARILSDEGATRLELDEWGTRIRSSAEGVSLPQYLDWPVKKMSDWEKYNDLFQGPVQERLSENWDDAAQKIKEQTHGIVTVHTIGLFAFPREVMGLENMLIALFDNIRLIEKMLDSRLEFYFRLYEKPIRDTDPDMAFIWEDMSYVNGPLISPEICRSLLLPRYKRLVDYFKSMGINRIVVDSDGDVSKLIPIWHEAGINGIMPFEVKAHNRVEELTSQWPDMVFIGGIDKHEIAKGPESIDAELNRRLPENLGRKYIPSLDHWIPPEISLNDYLYYRDRILDRNGN